MPKLEDNVADEYRSTGDHRSHTEFRLEVQERLHQEYIKQQEQVKVEELNELVSTLHILGSCNARRGEALCIIIEVPEHTTRT